MRSRQSILFAALAMLVGAGPGAFGQSGASFVPVTPCRAVDTRAADGPLGGPMMTAGTIRSFPIPTGSCGIPANASGYSLNVTVVAGPNLGLVELWPTGQAQPLASTLIFWPGEIVANAAIVPAGTDGAINAYANADTHLIVDINGYFTATAAAGSGNTAVGVGTTYAGEQNTAIGYNALSANTGSNNSATGAGALGINSTGNNNSALGSAALQSNSTGSANTTMGSQAMWNNSIGNDNTAVGYSALFSNTSGSNNSTFGANAGSSIGIGGNNVAVGSNALPALTNGSWNIAVGSGAGSSVTTGSYNIDIGAQGNAGDSNAIRIGNSANQLETFIAGIANTNMSSGGVPVVINLASGQLGIGSTSSRRYKEDIQDLGDKSDSVLQLRPVTFRYKKPDPDGSKPLHFGLVAEEVENVLPQLVVYDAAGQPEAVKYQDLPVLLLNELIKQERVIKDLQAKIEQLQANSDLTHNN